MAKKLSLKLLIDRKSQRVLFAEAEKEFVDFLLTLLSLPVASVVRLLKEHSMVGCIGNVYESIENLSDTYIQPGQSKNILLNPISPSLPSGQTHPLLLQDDSAGTSSMKFYSCQSHAYVSDILGVACPSCKNGMKSERTYVANNALSSSSSEQAGGFVKGVVTYTVMDDLAVKPMSTISSITVLNKFNVQEVGHLEESVVEVGMKEV